MYRYKNALRARAERALYYILQNAGNGTNSRSCLSATFRLDSASTPDQSHNFSDKVVRERGGDTRKRAAVAAAAAVGREKELIG